MTLAPASGTNAGPHRPRRFERVPDDLTTVDDLKGWVGDDLARARRVLDAETAKGDDARVTLVEHLEGLLTDPAPAVETTTASVEDDSSAEGQEPAGDGDD